MLVVVSDLHFEEEKSDVIPGKGGFPAASFSRNLPGKAYQSFIAHLASEAIRNKAERLDLVFAGDIFDLHRTSLWMDDDVRPYVNTTEVDEDLERRVIKILKAIQNEPGEIGTLLKESAALEDTATAFTHYDWRLQHQSTQLATNPIFRLLFNSFEQIYTLMGEIYFSAAACRQHSLTYYRALQDCLGDPDAAETLTRRVMAESLELWNDLHGGSS